MDFAFIEQWYLLTEGSCAAAGFLEGSGPRGGPTLVFITLDERDGEVRPSKNMERKEKVKENLTILEVNILLEGYFSSIHSFRRFDCDRALPSYP